MQPVHTAPISPTRPPTRGWPPRHGPTGPARPPPARTPGTGHRPAPLFTPLFALVAGAMLSLTACPVKALVTFYERENFEGRSFSTERMVVDLARRGFADRASSVVVRSERWEVCDERGFRGRCAVLRQGQYPSLRAMGLNDRLSSARVLGRDTAVTEDRYAPPPLVERDFRRRDRERLYDAPVLAVHAVVGAPEQRCWVEREQVSSAPPERKNNVPGAVIGGVLGGILGHQIGGGTGRDIATVGGVVGGAVIGSRVGGGSRGDPVPQSRDVERCRDTPNRAEPAYWDVSYRFQGRDHQVQMTHEPGPSIRVNGAGEPRL
jgi:uncharacterized protein YcfJ